jgi:uncharacterized protein
MANRRRVSLILAGLALPLGAAAQAASPFDCSMAKSAAEVAVCDSAELDALDRDASHLYYAKRDAFREAGKYDAADVLRTEQLGFLRQRDECGENVACIATLYKVRLKTLGE